MAFLLWQDRTYRSLLDYEKLPQVEQDRIFNELVVARAAIEGHRITSLIRLRMGWRHFWNDFKDWKTYRKG